MKSFLHISADLHFLRSGTISLGLGMLGMFVQLIFGVVLARSLGPTGYGVYAYALLITSIAVIPIDSGLSTYFLRSASRLFYSGDYAAFTRMLVRALSVTAIYSLAVYAVLAPIFYVWDRSSRPGGIIFYMPLALLLSLAFSKPAMVASYAANRVNHGQFLARILQPLIGVAGLAGFWLYRSRIGQHLSFEDGLNIQSISLAVTSVLAIIVCRRALDFHRGVRLAGGRAVQLAGEIGRPAVASIFHLTLYGVVLFANAQADMFILGLRGSAASLGVYKIAVTASGVVSMPIVAFNAILSPRISQMYVSERAQLQSILKASAKITTACALAGLMVLILFGRFLIAHVFGSAYSDAYWPMVILCAGQVFNCATGSVGNVLNMTGKEAWVLRGTIASGAFNVVACLVLAYTVGIVGAAMATTISGALWNGIMTIQQRRLVGLRCAAVDVWEL